VENKFCYKCGNIATSREHVPPICLFPEAKDVFGLNFRKDLITVSSRDGHNSNKSHDDEFLMVSIDMILTFLIFELTVKTPFPESILNGLQEKLNSKTCR
jgi:hypothetical protein